MPASRTPPLTIRIRIRRFCFSLAAVATLAAVFWPGTVGAEPWLTAPAGQGADALSGLFWIALVVAAAGAGVVELLLLIAALRFRRRASLPAVEPLQVRGDGRIEVIWTVVPALLLGMLVWIGARSVGTLQAATTEGTQVIQVEGYQFGWTVRYPGFSMETSNEVRIPVGQPVTIELSSRDVIHSFWVPQLSAKMDAIPGRVGRMPVTATEPGTYRGVCAELCGSEHARMLFSVRAMPAGEFREWLSGQAGESTTAAGGNVEPGKQVFAQKGCVACHTLAAVPGATAAIGPRLDGVGSRASTRKPGLTAEEYLRESIRSPNAFVVEGFPPAMPPIEVTDDELASLIAMLLEQK